MFFTDSFVGDFNNPKTLNVNLTLIAPLREDQQPEFASHPAISSVSVQAAVAVSVAVGGTMAAVVEVGDLQLPP
jgi:hypothetical protein